MSLLESNFQLKIESEQDALGLISTVREACLEKKSSFYVDTSGEKTLKLNSSHKDRIHYNYIDQKSKSRTANERILSEKRAIIKSEIQFTTISEESDETDLKKRQSDLLVFSEGENGLSSSEKSQESSNGPIEIKLNRYFLDDEDNKYSKIVCFKCKKPGHFERNCMQEAKRVVCSNCLGEHHTKECVSIVCFNCGKDGHVKWNCSAKLEEKCKNCGKIGHISLSCGVLGLFLEQSNKEKWPSAREETNLGIGKGINEVKCIKCKDEGHVRCDFDDFENKERIVRLIRNDNLYTGESLKRLKTEMSIFHEKKPRKFNKSALYM